MGLRTFLLGGLAAGLGYHYLGKRKENSAKPATASPEREVM